ncbi:VOC family protein [Novosphingobium sp. fls2-241-R2A-195]|jgi:catechol 2,3-dioxygenase-like lactoylglutathione lyase family enzyme|uniref:VOC family protein n=1 Tax=Novosphingobium sp. fls2-241-R2A-195 TaxID=3040296 RepID=UPI00254B8950|nr:VOC family protein [Novosphingobium sp. fls2-241-R2A-195]
MSEAIGTSLVERISHVNLAIRDEQASRDFYVGLLGLTEVWRVPQPQPGLWLQIGSKQIHLLRPVDDDELPPRRVLQETPMAPHLAFSVADVKRVARRLEESGVTVIFSPYMEGQAFFTDPSGNILEILEDL